MRLTDLEPKFVHLVDPITSLMNDDMQGADGLLFLCPVCMANNRMDDRGVHSILCWTPSVPPSMSPGPGRWRIEGTGYDDLSLVAGSSSVFLSGAGGCQAHFFVRHGEIETC